MENVSKALIIAGAILITILLISIGIVVINSINNPINQSDNETKAMSVEMYLSKFTNYAGEQDAKAVKSLMDIALSYSGEYSSDNDVIVYVGNSNVDSDYFCHPWILWSPSKVSSLVLSSETYNVMIEKKGKYGAIPDEEGNIEEQVVIYIKGNFR